MPVERIAKPLFQTLMVLMSGFCLPLHAHHSTLVFETAKPIVVKGLIAEVRFANPHSAIFIDVTEPDGRKVHWAVENSATLPMTRQRGFDENTLKAGDPIEVCGYAPKSTAPAWWMGANKVITGRLLLLKTGKAEHWSHYGPLDACQAALAVEQGNAP